MKSIFDEKNIQMNASFNNKTEAIKAAGEILVNNDYVTEDYILDMLQREEIMSTYMGNHVSIPHGVNESQSKIKRSGISFVQVPEGVSFGEDKLAYIIIGIAGKENEHLEILSNIALVCSELDNIEILKNAETKEEIIELLKGAL
ncbi:PTS sugar transporter subunit IIA [Bacillus sp. FJAT-50079]|uniref:PTS sugar transporter subunit IIA n=1 Tax=Bacillus sp. FJAT-50079 TaxID=2833577 RepID=UPI001BC92FC9|nr:PTS sugar transporter subunit IIA [Bacillus sp. FJAT-50079]MBS4206616.1 PTS sugar transporter subunit IIA [Bacillus sp. FJAT-50079]